MSLIMESLSKERLASGSAPMAGITLKQNTPLSSVQERRTALISAAVTGQIDVRKLEYA